MQATQLTDFKPEVVVITSDFEFKTELFKAISQELPWCSYFRCRDRESSFRLIDEAQLGLRRQPNGFVIFDLGVSPQQTTIPDWLVTDILEPANKPPVLIYAPQEYSKSSKFKASIIEQLGQDNVSIATREFLGKLSPLGKIKKSIGILKPATEALAKHLDATSANVSIINRYINIPPAREGCNIFEEWCRDAVKIISCGNLSNIRINPNPQKASFRRDIVARNDGTSGFWRRIKERYNVHQVTFEVKNTQDLNMDYYRQAASYLDVFDGVKKIGYGNLGFLICRSESEKLANVDKSRARDTYHRTGAIILKISSKKLCSLLTENKNEDYSTKINKILEKMLDEIIDLY